jgi:G:T-mismatch repair DNA endonuclease (very short patch repair protein)
MINHRSADAYCEEDNTVALFHGDYWHCNPKIYEADYYHNGRKMTAKEMWEYDANSVKAFEDAGYKVIVVWESTVNVFARNVSGCNSLSTKS